MKNLLREASLVLFACTIATGCAHRPAAWTLKAIDKLHCGMSVDEVSRLLRKEPRALSGRGPSGTHFVSRGLHTLWFDFVDNSLVAAQPSWTSALMRDERGERTELCDP